MYHALASLVTSGALVVVGTPRPGRKTRYALASEAPAGDDASGEDDAGVDEAAGDAAAKGHAARDFDDSNSDDEPARPQHGSPALVGVIPRLWARPRGALLPLLSERCSFSWHDVADALRLPRCRASNLLVTSALIRLVSMKQLNRVGGSRLEGYRYAPSRATDSGGGGGVIAAEAGAEEAGAEEAAAAAVAAAPRKRKHKGRRREARAAAPAGAAAAGAPAAAGASGADWALVDPPPRVDEIGRETVRAGGALRFHLRDSATRKEVCVVTEMPAPAGGGCGTPRRRVFRITRAGASLAPPCLRSALLLRVSDVRDGWRRWWSRGCWAGRSRMRPHQGDSQSTLRRSPSHRRAKTTTSTRRARQRRGALNR